MTETTAASVLYEERGAVALVTLNRPHTLNSFTREMHQSLRDALDRAEAAPHIRALVLTGAGRGFCAGLDLSELDFTPGPGLLERADPGPVIEDAFNPTTRRLQSLRMPVICAVNGVAAGAGASVAMACDIAIAAPTFGSSSAERKAWQRKGFSGPAHASHSAASISPMRSATAICEASLVDAAKAADIGRASGAALDAGAV